MRPLVHKLPFNPLLWLPVVNKKAVEHRRRGQKFRLVNDKISQCKRKCYELLDKDAQQEIFDAFRKCSTKETEDMFLRTCMSWCYPKVHTRIGLNRSKVWTFSFFFDPNIDVVVCKRCFCDILQVSTKRIVVIQKKFENGDFTEKRGAHNNRKLIVTEEMEALLYAHLVSVPNRNSHYTRSKFRYFENPMLTVRKLFELFREFYFEKKDCPCPLKLKQYYKLFQKMKFAVSRPRSDTCDICEEYRIKLKINPTDNCRIPKQLHERRFKQHHKLKKKIIKNIPEDTLVVEFDYGQNLPVPLLSISKQFYKRLLWFHNFNVHSHHDGDSTFYTFYEYEAKKDALSVVSFLHDFLARKGVFESGSPIKKIIFLSDNAGGQNKNQTVIRYCAWISKKFDLDIEHIFPVVGHSFSQCDANFGKYGWQVKRAAPLASAEKYLGIFRTCRTSPSPFNVVHDPAIISDYTKMFDESDHFFPKPAEFKIRSYCHFKFIAGVLFAAPTYSNKFHSFQVVRHTTLNLPILEKPSPPGLKAAKSRDILSLLPFVENQTEVEWLKTICEKYLK